MTFNETGDQVDLIPESYKDKDWAKNLNSAEDLFKQFENAQSLIGRSLQLPGDNATDEDWAKVYNRLGRPEKMEDYGIKAPEGSAEELKKQTDQLAKIFHDNGLSKKQAGKIIESMSGLNADAIKKAKEMQDAKAQSDKNYEELVKKTFGDKKDEVEKTAKGLLDKFAPAELKSKLAELSPEALVVLSATLKGISDTYISEEDLKNLQNGTSSSGKKPEDFRKEAQDLMMSEPYKNVMHIDHDKTVAKVKELYEEWGKQSKK